MALPPAYHGQLLGAHQPPHRGSSPYHSGPGYKCPWPTAGRPARKTWSQDLPVPAWDIHSSPQRWPEATRDPHISQQGWSVPQTHTITSLRTRNPGRPPLGPGSQAGPSPVSCQSLRVSRQQAPSPQVGPKRGHRHRQFQGRPWLPELCMYV